MPTERTQLLLDATNLIDGDRHSDYGSAYDDFSCTAKFWQAYLERIMLKRGVLDVQPHDVALMMNLLKTSRAAWMPEKRDSWLDINGYTGCGWECVTIENEMVDL